MKFSCKNDFLALKTQKVLESDYSKKYLQYKTPKNEEIESLSNDNQKFSELLTKIRNSNISKEINDIKKRNELKFQQSTKSLSNQLLNLSLKDRSLQYDENDVGISNAILALTKYKKYLLEKESQSNEKYCTKFNSYLSFIYRDIDAILCEIQSNLNDFDIDLSLKSEIQNSIESYENFLNTPKSAFLSNKFFDFEHIFITYNQKLKDALNLNESVETENNTEHDHEQLDSPIPPLTLNSSKKLHDDSEQITNHTDSPSLFPIENSSVITSVNNVIPSLSADILHDFSSISLKNNSAADQKSESSNIESTFSSDNRNPFTAAFNRAEIPNISVKVNTEESSTDIHNKKPSNKKVSFSTPIENIITIPASLHGESTITAHSNDINLIPAVTITPATQQSIATSDTPSEIPRFGSSITSMAFPKNIEKTNLFNNSTEKLNMFQTKLSDPPHFDSNKEGKPSPFSQAFKPSMSNLKSPFSSMIKEFNQSNHEAQKSTPDQENKSFKIFPPSSDSPFSSNQNSGLFNLKSMLDETKSSEMRKSAQASFDGNQNALKIINPFIQNFDSPMVSGSMSNSVNTTNVLDNSLNKSTQSTPASANVSQVYTKEEKQAQEQHIIDEIKSEFNFALQYLEKIEQIISIFKQSAVAADFIPKFDTHLIILCSQGLLLDNFYLLFDKFKIFIAQQTYTINSSEVFIKDYQGSLEYISSRLIDAFLLHPMQEEKDDPQAYAYFVFQWMLTTARIYPNLLLITWCKLVKQFPLFIGNYGDFHIDKDLKKARIFYMSLPEDFSGLISPTDLFRLQICSSFVSMLFCVSLSNIWYYFATTEDILQVWGPNRVWTILARIIKQYIPIMDENVIFICDILDLCANSLEGLYNQQYKKFKHFIYNNYFPKVLTGLEKIQRNGGYTILYNHMTNPNKKFIDFYSVASQFRLDDFS